MAEKKSYAGLLKSNFETESLWHKFDVSQKSHMGMAKTATSQNGDKLKRLQVQSKRINLLSSIMDLFRVLLTKFQWIQVCNFCSAVIS